MKRKLMLFFVLLCGFLHGETVDRENVWLKTFYQTHDVDRFDRFWKKVVREKLLEKPNAASPTIGFASQVIHQNPRLLKGRLDNLKKIPVNQLKAVIDLLWHSDTPEAREILRAGGYPEYLSRLVQPIGSKQINEAGDLDFCWGWFFATGDTAALNPIISALDLGEYTGAAKRYQASKKTEDDRDAAYKDAIHGAAMWSLEANGREDKKIANHLEEVFANPTTPKSRGMWLAVILSRLMPDRYKVEYVEGTKDQPGAVKITALKSPAGSKAAEPSREFADMEATLAKVAKHAKEYPPRFVSDKERKQIEKELRETISSLLKELRPRPDEPRLLFLDGFANAMGHNLDFPGCADRSIESYERLLNLQPENGMAHFWPTLPPTAKKVLFTSRRPWPWA